MSREEASRHPSEAEPLAGVRHVVAVSSGKGGVGKSSVTANLGVALAQQGLRVGIIDADVWGFSIPRMLGVEQTPTVIDSMIVPPESHGVLDWSYVDPDTGVMTPDALRGAVDLARPSKLKAALPVHLAGRVCDMPGLADIAASAVRVIVLNDTVGRASVMWIGVTTCGTELMTTLPPP